MTSIGTRRAFMLVAGGLLAVASCSSKDDSSATTTKPTANSTASSTATGTKMTMAEVKVALVPGGAHPYFQPWIDGGKAAAKDFGLGGTTFNETAGWDQTKQNEVLTSLASQGYNTFGIFGVSPDTINTTFEDLRSQGFTVASLASCPAGDKNSASFCLSTDVETAAYKAAKAAIDAMGGKGTLVHLTGNKVDSNTVRRIAGVEKAVSETNGAVTLLEPITDIDVDLQTAQQAVADLLATRGTQINGIVTTAYNPAVAAADGVAKSGLDIKVVAIDDDPAILDGIRKGSVAATVAQNPYGQSYVGSYALAKLATGCTMANDGVIIDSGSFIVDKSNVETYNDERLATDKQLQADFDSKYLSC